MSVLLLLLALVLCTRRVWPRRRFSQTTEKDSASAREGNTRVTAADRRENLQRRRTQASPGGFPRNVMSSKRELGSKSRLLRNARWVFRAAACWTARAIACGNPLMSASRRTINNATLRGGTWGQITCRCLQHTSTSYYSYVHTEKCFFRWYNTNEARAKEPSNNPAVLSRHLLTRSSGNYSSKTQHFLGFQV